MSIDSKIWMIILLLTPALAVFADKGLELVHADSLVLLNTEDGRVQNLYGDVRMVQDSAYMKCEKAIFWEAEDRAHLEDQVVIYDGKHTLWADQVDYDGATRTEKATGLLQARSPSFRCRVEILTVGPASRRGR